MDTSRWNAVGRETNRKISELFDGIIERDEPGTAFPEDPRGEDLASVVLAEVVALNDNGRWREAHDRFDAAHAPFIPHMERMKLAGLTQAVVLGTDSFLVRRGDETEDVIVCFIDGDHVRTLEGTVGFALSRNRRHVALASNDGLVVSEGLGGARVATLPWPERGVIRPWRMSVSDDGKTVVLGNDEAGLWIGREEAWKKLAPSDDAADEETVDVLHAELSPDGRWVAYAWQDAPGHFIDRIGDDLSLARWAVVEGRSDYPYNARFTDDSSGVLLNARHMESGATTYVPLRSVEGLEAYDDLPEDVTCTDDYLRAYGMTFLPAMIEAGQEPIAWLGGAGWSHGARLSGGKPAFTHFFGSSLHAFDYDPASKRAIVASASGMLHVIDPHARDEEGRAHGYRPRKELYRWIFWDTLKSPIRW